MKTKKIRVTVVEDNSYYNHILEKQISELTSSKKNRDLKFEISSIANVDELTKSSGKNHHVIVFDNHFKNNKQQVDYCVNEIMDEVKSGNGDCFFISISGYREMNISAYLYRNNELVFTYSKQSSLRNENHEDKCSIPALNKLMEKYINTIMQGLNKVPQLVAA